MASDTEVAAVFDDVSVPVVDTTAESSDGDGFRVDSDSAANWLVRQIVESRSYADRVRQWAKDEIRRAERNEEKLMYLFGDQLRRWCQEEVVARGSRRRSVHLPAGRVGFRRTPTRLVVQDEAAAADWCSDHAPNALSVKAAARGANGRLMVQLLEGQLPGVSVRRQVLVSELRRIVDATGELPEGCEVEGDNETFFVG